ncbi:hypothetical protein DFJ73DRAFT_59013 [Zopfochytrium polystomum]|nr:hypothetical protein DFJ73DRAFT_59013 [Zopfochytrium polystomum]
MYRNNFVPQLGIDADEAYAQKIRLSLAEMVHVKEAAVRSEDFLLAEQTRQKIVALQAQLAKMEHQLNADLVLNAVTAWQVALAESLDWHLGDLANRFRKSVLKGSYPLKDKAHTDFLEILKILPVNYFDSLIRSFLLIVPQDLPDVAKSHFGWDSFAKRIPNLAKQSSEVVEVVKSTVVLSILDIMIRITNQLTMASLKRDTHTLFLKHAFQYVRSSATRRLTVDFEAKLFEQIGVRWSVVIGDLSCIDRTEVFRQISAVLDVTRRTPQDEVTVILAATRYISFRPATDKEAQETALLIHELTSHFEKNKKTNVRLAVIQALERLVQPIDFSSKNTAPDPWEMTFHNELVELHRLARRWANSSEDLRAAAVRLSTIITLNTNFEYFRTNIDTLLQDMFVSPPPPTLGIITRTNTVKSSLQSHAFECALQLLRGRYYIDTLSNSRDRLMNTFSVSDSYSYLTRPAGEEPLEAIIARLKIISDALFVNRRGPLNHDYLDTCVDIVVQMAAQNLQFALRLISQLLSTNTPDHSEHYYIALRSLRTMLDADSRFTAKASCRVDPEFRDLLNNIPYEFEGPLIMKLQFCEAHAGIGFFGRAGSVLEPVLHSSLASDATGSGNSKAGGNAKRMSTISGRFDDDPVLRLKESLESLRTPTATAAAAAGPLTPRTSEDGGSRRRLTVTDDASILGRRKTNSHEEKSSPLGRRRPTLTEETGLGRKKTVTPTASTTQTASPGRVIGGLSDAVIGAANLKVGAAVAGWYEACGLTPPRAEKLVHSSRLVDSARIKHATSVGTVYVEETNPLGLGLGISSSNGVVRLRPDLALLLRVYRQVLHLVQYIPHPELVSGQLFIGSVLLHSQTAVATEASAALQVIFKRIPEMRFSIINGFISFIKTLPHGDDISYCTIILQLGLLLDYWANKETAASQARPSDDAIYKLSCKLDACTIILLARPNPRIRHAALTALSHFQTIAQRLSSQRIAADATPLHTILTTRREVIARRALHAYLQRDALGEQLIPRATAGITILTLEEVAVSDFGKLFRMYLGELAREFVEVGRSKAVRHCAKFLRLLAIPYMTSVETVDADFVATYSSYAVLMMSLAGVPLKSEDTISSDNYAGSDKLLFQYYEIFIPPILNSDNFWEIKAIVTASYFMHRLLLQLYIARLRQWHNDMLQNPQRLNPRMIDNTLAVLRTISQCPEFPRLLRQSPVFQPPSIVVYTDMLAFAETVFDASPQFLTQGLAAGPPYRIKSAVNVCVITDRVAFAILAGRNMAKKQGFPPAPGQNDGQEGLSPRTLVGADAPSLEWSPTARRFLAMRMVNWSLQVDADSAVPAPTTPATPGGVKDNAYRLAKLRRKLGQQVGPAASGLFSLGDIFEGAPIPTEILNWMAKIEARGCKVFSPEILYSYDNAMGTVLANAYAAKSSVLAFTEAVFEQILPRFEENEDAFLAGMASATDDLYISMLHALPLPTNDNAVERDALVLPVLDEDASEKIRQNLGTLIYFGLYNLMSSNRLIRIRAFQFIRDLFCRYNPDPSIDMTELMNKYFGAFHSGVAACLKDSIVDLSRLAAELFSAESPSFLWEAVRCSRSVQQSDNSSCLMPSQQFSLELVLPWCRHVDFSKADEDIVSAEFFRSLMDAAFYKPKYDDLVQRCWAEVASSPEFGADNAGVLAEVVVQILGKFDRQLRDQAFSLLTRVYAAHPEVVADCLIRYLSAAALPWRAGMSSDPARMGVASKIVREYVNVLYTAVNGGATAVQDPAAEYTASSRAASMLIAELLLQNNSILFSHLPLLLNYVFLNIPAHLGGSSPVTTMLVNLVEGRLALLHQSQEIASPDFAAKILHMKKILLLFERGGTVVVWGDDEKETDSIHRRKIPIVDLIDLILSAFESDRPNLLQDLTSEALSWASDILLSQETSSRAIDTYNALLRLIRTPAANLLNPLSKRLSEQISILSSLETEASQALGWDRLTEASKALRRRTEDVIASVLRLQSVLIAIHAQKNTLNNLPELFWGAASVLYLPPNIFPQTWRKAIDNCLDFLAQFDRSSLRAPESPFMMVYVILHDLIEGLQPTLLLGLFEEDIKIRDSAMELLVQSWRSLADVVVDHSPVGLLYTILYALTWIFSKLWTEPLEDDGGVGVDIVAAVLQEVLHEKNAAEFAGIISCLQVIVQATRMDPDGPPPVPPLPSAVSNPNGTPTSPPLSLQLLGTKGLTPALIDNLLERCATNLAIVFFPACLNNVADYCLFALRLNPTQARVSLKLTQVLWSRAVNMQSPATGFKALLRKLPFMKKNQESARALMAFVMNGVGDLDDFIKEIDLTSPGRVETVPEFDRPVASVARALKCLLAIM